MAERLMTVEGLNAGYGKSQVLFGMALQVDAGHCTTLLGRNGMGKTTTIKSIMGLLRPSGGQVQWKGRSITAREPHAVAKLGLGLVPEGRQIFPNLTVRENLVATAATRHRSAAGYWNLERVHQLFPRLAERANNFGNQLSGGEQQMLAIGRALMTNPHLLILDEATEGLAPLIREEIWQCLAALRAQGQAILVIDKYVKRLMALADRHTLIERGQVVWQGSSAQLEAQPALWQRYIGV